MSTALFTSDLPNSLLAGESMVARLRLLVHGEEPEVDVIRLRDGSAGKALADVPDSEFL